MNYKKIMLSILASFVTCQTVMPMNNEDAVYKDAIRGAAHRAFWGWAKARGLPTVAGAAMVTIPPALAIIGFMGGIGAAGGGASRGLQKVFECAAVVGYLSYISVPTGAGLLARQGILIARDLSLYNNYTHSTAHYNIRHLPEIAQIQRMDNHDQLLNAVRRHANAEGNTFERWAIDTPGFRGYKKDEATHP